jgi:hypothetical protein
MKVSFYFFVFLSVFFLSGCATTTVESRKVKQQEYHSFVLGKEPVWFTDRKYMQLVEEKRTYWWRLWAQMRFRLIAIVKWGVGLMARRIFWVVRRGRLKKEYLYAPCFSQRFFKV